MITAERLIASHSGDLGKFEPVILVVQQHRDTPYVQIGEKNDLTQVLRLEPSEARKLAAELSRLADAVE